MLKNIMSRNKIELRLTGLYALRGESPSAYKKPQSGFSLCAVFLRHIFLCAGNLRFPLSRTKNVAYNRNVICHKIWKFIGDNNNCIIVHGTPIKIRISMKHIKTIRMSCWFLDSLWFSWQWLLLQLLLTTWKVLHGLLARGEVLVIQCICITTMIIGYVLGPVLGNLGHWMLMRKYT